MTWCLLLEFASYLKTCKETYHPVYVRSFGKTDKGQMKTMEKEHKIEHDELDAAKERLSRQIE